MNTFTKLWSDVVTPSDAMKRIEEQRKEVDGIEPSNLEEQAISLVGRDIYEKLVKGYTEKQWGKDCKELPAFIIKRLPVRFTFNNNYFNDRYQGIPIGGYNVIIDKMLKGSDVELGVDFLKDKDKYLSLGEKVLYTGMIDEYFNYSLGNLDYRSLRFENEILDIDDYQGNAVFNYTDRETDYTRIIEHKHFEFNTCSGTVITREYPSDWKLGDEAYYPVNDEKNNTLFEKYKELASKESNVIFGGRLGHYKYYDMDKVIIAALELVESEK
jgi:UDP-galactopyranose mutase